MGVFLINNKSIKGFNSFTLKIIAITAMFIDHVGIIFLSGYSIPYVICRLIGRISFPIFAFLIAEGAYYTKNKANYALRLGVFAVISEIFFDLAIHNNILIWEYQNVFFTLLLGLCSIMLYEYYSNMDLKAISFMFPLFLGFIAEEIHSDYGFFGVLLIFVFYKSRDLKFLGFILRFLGVFALSISFNSGFNILQLFAVISLIFISYHTKEKGCNVNKYIFYLFYPAHLFILYLISLYVFN
jgi:hypothetical protein